MGRVKTTNKTDNSNSVNWVLFCLIAVVLYFQTNLADPFNSPKSWILHLVAAWLIGHLIATSKYFVEFKYLIYVVIFFMLSVLIVSVFTDSAHIAFFGDTQRRNGFFSYMALGIIFIASARFIGFKDIKKFFSLTFIVALLSIVYGTMQTFGRDFVAWNNPHNALIGTLGNPNFSAAVMAIMATLLLTSVFFVEFSRLQKFFSLIGAVMLIFLIYRSGARQGLLSFAAGMITFFIIWAFRKNKKLGLVTLSISIVLLVFSIFGMLQMGPLERFLYKPSVNVRGFYWRAGIEMFKDNPILGVGMDRYGYYFNQYREVEYPLRYGFEITSSNAHNTFIQFFATGGILLGISYLALNLFVIKCAIVFFRKNNGPNRLVFASIFSAWVCFHAQSFVSIDNLGISIWGWILGGMLCGISISDSRNEQSLGSQRKHLINLKQIGSSAIPTLLLLVIIVFQIQGESRAYQADSAFNPQDNQSVQVFQEIQLKVINTPLIDPNYKLRSAENLILTGGIDDGLAIIKEIHSKDPRNEIALVLLSNYYESIGSFSSAIEFREKIKKLNPWNAKNLLLLGRDYKNVANYSKSNEVLQLLSSFSTGKEGGPILEQAQKELS